MTIHFMRQINVNNYYLIHNMIIVTPKISKQLNIMTLRYRP